MSTTGVISTSVPAARPRFASLPEWLAWQEHLHFTAIDLGLDRCRAVAARMDLLDPEYAVVSIAGTNGKGSSAAMLDLILRTAGYRSAVYTSPHLIRYNERISIGGTAVIDDELCQAFDRVDRARGDISLTYFEFGTLAALDLFRRRDVEIAVLEVGLGGRLDAVNMIDADVALVTTVDLDHERWLGFDRESIGREKAGIFRPGRPAICADPDPPACIAHISRGLGARPLQLHRDFTYSARPDGWEWKMGERFRVDLPRPSANHERQVQNAAGVLAVLSQLQGRFPVSDSAIREALAAFRMPGRFQVVPGQVPCIFDVAHNVQAAEVLHNNLENLPCHGRTHMVIGMLKDKNHAAVLAALADSADLWYVTSLPGERGAAADQLLDALGETGLAGTGPRRGFDDVGAALQAATAAAVPGDRVVVTGSFVTVGAAMRNLNVSV